MKMTKQQIFQKVKPELLEVESARNRMARKYYQRNNMVFVMGLSLVLLFVLVGIILQDLEGSIIFIFLSIFVLAIVSNLVNFRSGDLWTSKQIDGKIGSAIMKAAHPEWEFASERQISSKKMSETGLSALVSGFEGSNLTTGKYQDTEFAFSLHKSVITGKYEDNIDTRLVMIFDFHKDIKERTVIFPDKAQNTLGTWLGKEVQKMGWKGLDLVYFEDPIFEKHFAVYGTDQIEARYILTPSMMQGLVKLREKYDHDFTFSFANGKVCVVISGLPDYRNSLDTRIIPDGAFYHFYRPVEMAIEVIDTMNLNTRIWSKE